MELAISIATVSGEQSDLLAQVDPGTTVAALAEAVATRLGIPTDTPLYLGARRLPPGEPLDGLGLAHGVRLGAGGPATEPEPALAPLELAVVGGPAAGVAVPLRPGEQVSIGRSGDDGLLVADDHASRRHAMVAASSEASPAAAVVTDNGSRNGVGWNGYRLDRPQPLVDGDVFQIGQSFVALRGAAPAAAVLDPPDALGHRRFHRPPRLPRPEPANELEVPSQPEPPGGRHFPLASLVAPILIGVVLVVVLKSWSYAAFMLLSPVMLVANHVSDRRHGRRDHDEKLAAYEQASARLADDLAALVAADERARRLALPDPAALARTALAPTARLWERRPDDPDFLALRVGLADLPANVRLRRAPSAPATSAPDTEPPTSHHVPVAFDLGEAGVAGVAGPRAAVLQWSRAALLQLAVLHRPRDVQIVVLTGQDTAGDWTSALMLPHLVPSDPGWGCRRLVGAGRQQVEERLATLGRMIDERAEAARDQLRAGPPAGPRTVVVVDGARRLRAVRGMAELLRRGPEAGVVALCLDEHEDNLPEECRVTAVWQPPADVTAGAPIAQVTLRVHGRQPVEGIVADGCSDALVHRVARALAPIRDPDGPSGPGEVPRAVRLLDLVGPDPPAACDVATRWASARDGRSTEAVIGAQAGGPFSVDLRRDGPHALVAGTTGAGKSELLQTLVASLALANRPDAMTFVLVDYKGGSAFKECRLLPHCVGMVTDLDGHLAARALASLTAELKRREAVLAGVGAKDLEDYWALTAGSGAAARLPRLAIVIDEFATLVEEVPEFVKGVVGIGMRGRSLGVHVILATQRPAGVVSAEIRANVNLRICLRVANPQDSSDVIDLPDASRIGRDLPGRGYVLAGYRELTLFQTARVGGVRPAVAAGGAGPFPPRVDLMVPAVMGQAPPGPATTVDEDDPTAPTDLGLIVRAVQEAARAEGVAVPPSPWLPPLPEVVRLDSLPAADGGPSDGRRSDGMRSDGRRSDGGPSGGGPSDGALRAVIGVVDRPEVQAQEPFATDLAAWGSLLVAGAVRSGRSTALRAIASRLCAATGPHDLHLYALDAGNRALEPLAGLPHVGAVVPADDAERTARLLDMLTALVADRTRASVAEPPVVVLVDRLESFLSRYADRDAGRLVDALDALLREGPAVGVHFVISGDRTAFTSRLASAVEARLVLRQADRGDYAVFGLDPRVVPSHMPNGRAVWAQSGHEVQIGVLGPDGSDAGQVAALQAQAAGAFLLPPGSGRRPRRLEPLPERITLRQLGEGPSDGAAGRQGDAVATLGVGGDELVPVLVDLAELGPGFVIAGPPRSGRSTALATIVRTLRGREGGDRRVVLVTPRPSPLQDLAGLPGVVASLSGGPGLADELPAALAAAGRPAALVVDDAELLADGPAARILEGIVRSARDDGVVVVAAATTDDLLLSRFRGWLADARRSRCGLVLTPASATDGEVFDLRLPRSTGGQWPAGRALLAVRGQTSTIQVALPE